ncbi:hypothetical protein NPIL_143721 [Nephila pilipes]|uniref:Uncharacterized protein n=1 Tax=Nephila pilipes TaxID=299642 RepID=A0A8X6MPI2_NEPPI|nr:hypothetical protein NPIL_143721 [Nephila pilipes]
MEEALAIWIQDSNDEQISVNGLTIKQKTLSIYKYLKERLSSSAHRQKVIFCDRGGEGLDSFNSLDFEEFWYTAHQIEIINNSHRDTIANEENYHEDSSSNISVIDVKQGLNLKFLHATENKRGPTSKISYENVSSEEEFLPPQSKRIYILEDDSD